jgi:hypothetical protein
MTEAEEQRATEPTAEIEPNAEEVTLATPRFDAIEAQEAQPVVPLAQVRRRARIWPLLLLSACLGGALSLLALHFYERPRTLSAQPAPPPQQAAAPTEHAHAADETAQVAAPPEDKRAPVSVATSAVVAETANKSAEKETEKETQVAARAAERAAERAPRPQRAEQIEARPPVARHNEPPDEPVARVQRPRTVAHQARAPQTRNVDRIRDIFEGAPPPE